MAVDPGPLTFPHRDHWSPHPSDESCRPATRGTSRIPRRSSKHQRKTKPQGFIVPFSRVHQSQSRSFDGAVRLPLLLIRIMNRESVKLPAADTAAEPLWSLGPTLSPEPQCPGAAASCRRRSGISSPHWHHGTKSRLIRSPTGFGPGDGQKSE